VTAMAAPFLPAGLQLTGKRNDTITFNSQWPYGKTDQMLANMTGSAALGWDSAEYMGLQIAKTEIKANIEKGKLTIPPFTTTVNQGTLNFGANADFRQKPTLLKTPQPMDILKNVQINDRMAAAMLKNVNPIFANAKDTRGAVNLKCSVLEIPISGGSPNDAHIEANAEIQNLKLNSPILNALIKALSLLGKTQSPSTTMYLHPTDFVLNKGFLTYNRMQIDLGELPLFFSGRHGLDNSLKASVVLPITTRGQVVTTTSENLSGTTLPFKGTVNKPELDLGELLKSGVQQEIQNILGGKQKTTTQPGQQQPATQEQQLIKGLEGLIKGKK
jgi:hypothetical protein